MVTESDATREEGMSVILRGCLDRVIPHAKKDVAVDRVIKFFCNFMSIADEQCFNKGIEHMLMRSCANDKTVRFRACQILATSLAEMNQDADIPEQLFLAMTQLLIPRLRDRATNVRLWAVQAVGCLQDPEDENDLIILELLRLMGTDSSADIRIAALENICICPQSLTAVVERIRDIKPDVRVAALKALKKGNVTVRHLNATLRAQVIQYSLNDRSEKARQAARELVLSWADGLDSKVAKLFHFLNLHSNRIDIDQATDHCSHVGWSIMHEIDTGNGEIVSAALRQGARDDAPDWDAGFSALTPADILWAVVRCEYARQCFADYQASELLDALVPDTVRLCELLYEGHGSSDTDTGPGANEDLRESPQLQLSMKLLLRMARAKLKDSSADVEGAAQLATACRRLLSDPYLPENLVEPLLDSIPGDAATILSGTASLGRALYEQIKESCLLDESNVDEEEAEEKEELQELTIIRAMEIASWVFQRTVGVADLSDLDKEVVAMVEEMTPMIWESMQQPVADLRALAVRCLGILGTASVARCARARLTRNVEVDVSERDIILEVATNDAEETDIRCCAIQALGDIAAVGAMVTGGNLSQRDKLHIDQLTYTLLRLVSCGEEALVCVASETAAKLLLNGTLHDSRLFAHLCKAFCEPALVFGDGAASARLANGGDEITEARALIGSQTHLQQALSIFFATYTCASGVNTEEITARQQVALESVSEFTSSVAAGVRDGEADASVMMRCCSQLLALSDSLVVVGVGASSGVKMSAEKDMRARFQVTISACIMREVLKLGTSKADKTVAKEYCKVLVTMAPAEWIDAAIVNVQEVGRVVCTILHACKLDVTTVKNLENIVNMCPDGVLEDENGMNVTVQSFLGTAPGLSDLVELMAPSEAEQAVKGCEAVAMKVEQQVANASGSRRSQRKTASTKAVNYQDDEMDGRRSEGGELDKTLVEDEDEENADAQVIEVAVDKAVAVDM